MLSSCVPACVVLACVVPAGIVPNLFLRGALNLVFAHGCPRFDVVTRVSSLLHLPSFVATMEVCARCVGGSRSVTIDGYLQQETR